MAGCSAKGELYPGQGRQDFAFERALGFQVLDGDRILVTDGGGADFTNQGSKVFIINTKGELLWSSRIPLHFAHSAVLQADGSIVIPDTNADRIIAVDQEGELLWSSETWNKGSGTLSDGSRLDYPNFIQVLSSGNYLVSDRYNSRVIEVTPSGTLIRSFTQASKQHAPQRLPNGNTLISDSDSNRIIELDPEGQIIWQFGQGLQWPRYAQRLANGNTLITDSNNNRILEVDAAGTVLWQWGKDVLSRPYQAEEQADGSILIADAQNARLLRIDRAGTILWKFEKAPDLTSVTHPSLLNGGAEEGTSDGPTQKINAWIAADLLAPSNAIWMRDTALAYKGKASFSIRADVQSKPQENRWWAQRIHDPSIVHVTFKAWVKTLESKGGTGISLNFLNERGAILGGATSSAVRGTSDWQELEIAYSVPKGTHTISLNLSLIGPGQAWWDEVELLSVKEKNSKQP